MRKSAIHYGDLIDLMRVYGKEGASAGASALGFEHKPNAKPQLTKKAEPSEGRANKDKDKPDQDISAPQTEQQRVPLTFYTCRKIANRQGLKETPDIATQNIPLPIPNLTNLPPLEHQDLVPWNHIWPLIHEVLSVKKMTQRIDNAKLVKRSSDLKPICSVPRLAKKTWAPSIQLWLDMAPRLTPFRADMWLVNNSILNVCGKSGYHTVILDENLRPIQFSNTKNHMIPGQLKTSNPILILSDLGSYDISGQATIHWLQLGKRLKRENASPTVLTPCPPEYWHPDLPSYFKMIYWDRGQSYRTVRYPNAVPSNDKQSLYLKKLENDQAQRAVQLLSLGGSALRLEYSLLRAIRLTRSEFSAAHEVAAMQHKDVNRNVVGCWFANERSDDIYSRNFSKLPSEEKVALRKLILGCHQSLHGDVIAEECLVYDALNDDLTNAEAFIKSVVSDVLSANNNKGEQFERHWSIALLKRLPANIKRQYRDLYLYWASLHKDDFERGEAIPPSDIRLDDLYPVDATNNTHTGYLIQQGSAMRIRESAEVGFPLRSVSVAKRRVQVGEASKANSIWFLDSSDNLLDGTLSQPLILDSHCGTYKIHSIQIPQGATGLYRNRLGLFLQVDSTHLPAGQNFEELPYPEWADTVQVDEFGVRAEVLVANQAIGFRYIPPGEFLMGSPEDEPERWEEREQQHPVELTHGYWLAETACTQALWQAVMGENPSEFKDDLNNPIETVSWADCKVFLKTLNQKVPDIQARMPTEAEWEYACRAGTQTPFSFGENITTEQANYDGNFPYNNVGEGEYRETTIPVKKLPPNPWGLYQMHGNVWEWCQDWFQDNLGAEKQIDPFGPSSGELRVLRGGSWFSNARGCRGACRDGYWPGYRSDGIGLRLARGLLPSSKPGGAEQSPAERSEANEHE